MSLPNITYKTIIDSMKSYIKSVCVNVGDSYDSSLNSFLKAGTSKSAGTVTNYYYARYGAAYRTAGSFSVYVSNGVSQVTTSTIDSEIDTYFSGLGLTSTTVSYNIDAKSYYLFIANIINFCVQRMKIAVYASPNTNNQTNVSSFNAETTSGRQVVYVSGTTSGGKTMTPSASATSNTLAFNSTSDIMAGVIKAIQGASYRTAYIKYTIK
jgi:hypothetical protein